MCASQNTEAEILKLIGNGAHFRFMCILVEKYWIYITFWKEKYYVEMFIFGI